MINETKCYICRCDYTHSPGKPYCDECQSNCVKERNKRRKRLRKGCNKFFFMRTIEEFKHVIDQNISGMSRAMCYKIYKKALEFNVITRPTICSQCNKKDTRIVGHHRSYDKPIDVVWLCDVCHKVVHADKISQGIKKYQKKRLLISVEKQTEYRKWLFKLNGIDY